MMFKRKTSDIKQNHILTR